jgi:hypothetical protein
LTEAELDEQVLPLFAKMRVGDDESRAMFTEELRRTTRSGQRSTRERVRGLKQQHAEVLDQQDRLVPQSSLCR